MGDLRKFVAICIYRQIVILPYKDNITIFTFKTKTDNKRNLKSKFNIFKIGVATLIVTVCVYLYTWFSIQEQIAANNLLNSELPDLLTCDIPLYAVNHLPFYVIGLFALVTFIYGLMIQDKFKIQNLIGLILYLVTILLCVLPLPELIAAYR